MYMRPHLSRKRTSSREILAKEHNIDVLTYNETLTNGMGFESDVEKIACLFDSISKNDTLSDEEKQPVLQQLSQILCALKKEYSVEVESEQADIEFSMQERIDEMESATREREFDLFCVESTIWETDAVDKDKLVFMSNELLRKYQTLLENSQSDLQRLMREAEEQRIRIKEHRTKR